MSERFDKKQFLHAILNLADGKGTAADWEKYVDGIRHFSEEADKDAIEAAGVEIGQVCKGMARAYRALKAVLENPGAELDALEEREKEANGNPGRIP